MADLDGLIKSCRLILVYIHTQTPPKNKEQIKKKQKSYYKDVHKKQGFSDFSYLIIDPI